MTSIYFVFELTAKNHSSSNINYFGQSECESLFLVVFPKNFAFLFTPSMYFVFVNYDLRAHLELLCVHITTVLVISIYYLLCLIGLKSEGHFEEEIWTTSLRFV